MSRTLSAAILAAVTVFQIPAQNISDEAIVMGKAIVDAIDNLPARPLYFQAANLKFKDTSTSMINALGTAIVWGYEQLSEGPLHIPRHVRVGVYRYKINGLADGCLQGCDMTFVNIPGGARTIPRNCFASCSHLREVELHSDITFVEDGAFRWCRSLTALRFHSGLKFIGDFCFSESGLEEFTVPKSVESLGQYAFSGCRQLRSVTFTGHWVEVINGYTFDGCESLTSLILPPGCTTIYSYAFNNCGIRHLSLPAQMQAIYALAFAGTGIERIDCHAVTPPKTAVSTFTQADVERIELHIPTGTESAYRASVWNRFRTIIPDL